MEMMYRVGSSPHIHLEIKMNNVYLLRLRKLDQLLNVELNKAVMRLATLQTISSETKILCARN